MRRAAETGRGLSSPRVGRYARGPGELSFIPLNPQNGPAKAAFPHTAPHQGETQPSDGAGRARGRPGKRRSGSEPWRGGEPGHLRKQVSHTLTQPQTRGSRGGIEKLPCHLLNVKENELS